MSPGSVALGARLADRRDRARGRHRHRLRRRFALEQSVDGAQPHALQLVGGQPVERLPGRDPQRRLQQVDAASHLDRVLRQPADVALDDVELLGGIDRFQRLLALLAEPDLVHQHLRLRRHIAARAAEQQERAHRFAVAVGRQHRAGIATAGRRQGDGPADGGDHVEAADGASERERPQHRAAVGIERQHRAADTGILRERLELARRVGGDVTGGGDPHPAARAADIRGAFAPPLEAHRRAAAVVRWHRSPRGRLHHGTQERERAPDKSKHADPRPVAFPQRFLCGVWWKGRVSHTRLPVLEAAGNGVQPEKLDSPA